MSLLGEPAPNALTTACTISLASPEAMANDAAKASDRALLKIKLGAPGDTARIAAVRRAAPRAELIVDANEGWTPENLEENFAACGQANVTLVEQPLPANRDEVLTRIARPIAVCADESVQATASLSGLIGKYDAVNIKLDKTGGLTEALAMTRRAEQLGLTVMVGCMVATSLAMAPAILVAQRARVVDLDGPLLLARDRPQGLRYEGSLGASSLERALGVSILASGYPTVYYLILLAKIARPGSRGRQAKFITHLGFNIASGGARLGKDSAGDRTGLGEACELLRLWSAPRLRR